MTICIILILLQDQAELLIRELSNYGSDASGLSPQLRSVPCSFPQKHSLDVGCNVSPGLSVQS